MKRAFVFIDGNNFYFKVKNLTSDIDKNIDKKISLLDFNFRKFAEWLVQPNKLIEIRYYIGVIRRQRNNVKSENVTSLVHCHDYFQALLIGLAPSLLFR